MSNEIDLSQVLDYRGKQTPPHYAPRNAAGLDLTADIEEAFELQPGEITLVATGLWLNLPENTEMQVRSKSGLALHHGVTVVNSPGTVNADYKDEVGVILINLGRQPYVIEPGAKVAQGVFAPVIRAVQGFTGNTKERSGGYGSTGL